MKKQRKLVRPCECGRCSRPAR